MGEIDNNEEGFEEGEARTFLKCNFCDRQHSEFQDCEGIEDEQRTEDSD